MLTDWSATDMGLAICVISLVYVGRHRIYLRHAVAIPAAPLTVTIPEEVFTFMATSHVLAIRYSDLGYTTFVGSAFAALRDMF